MLEIVNKLIEPFVTNTDKNVFGLKNLPEVVKGALFSRYSRSDRSIREILADEFIGNEDLDIDVGLIPHIANANDKASAFYDRVLIGYGDDSIAELGSAHIACERISNIAAKALEDSRLGISPLEKSTRYVDFSVKDSSGKYLYYREPAIMASPFAVLYEQGLDHLFDTYAELIYPLAMWVRSTYPQKDGVSERAYTNATKAKVFDLLRGLLPMATLTNVGLHGNGRAFEYLLIKMSASSHPEVRELAEGMNQELQQLIPSFVKRSNTEHGQQYSNYIAQNRNTTAAASERLLGGISPSAINDARLVDYDDDGENNVIAAILYPHVDIGLPVVKDEVTKMSIEEKESVIKAYVGDRKSRFQKPGRAFEETYYTFDILADIGAYRDLHRHRIMTQERQRYTVRHGYSVPEEIGMAGCERKYRSALDNVAEIAQIIEREMPVASQYLVPFAFKIRWRIKLNLREAYHLIELRSSPQGHSSYRSIAQSMYKEIKKVHPLLASGMNFVDMGTYGLERIDAEVKLDRKLAGD